MRPSFCTTPLLVACLSLGPAVWAQDEAATEQAPPDAPDREVTLGAPPSADPLAPDTAERGALDPTHPDGLPRVEGILGIPASRIEVDPRVLGVAPGEPLPQLRREGEFLRNRTGRLLPAGERGYAVFVVDPDLEAGEDKPLAMVVAPNRALEAMEELVEKRGEAVGFTLSGQVHTYRGVNYLMVTAPPRPWLEAAQDEARGPEAAATEEPAVQEDVPQVDVAEEEPDDAGPLSPEEELAELLRQRETQGTPGDPGSAGNSTPGQDEHRPDRDRLRVPDIPRGGAAADPAVVGVAPGQQQAELVDEGAFVVRRTGRLVRSGDGAHAMFVFDADRNAAGGDSGGEPPMIIQACKLLEDMEQIIHQFGDHLPFVVTGQVQTYRGANYLLPSVMRQEFDRGNLE